MSVVESFVSALLRKHGRDEALRIIKNNQDIGGFNDLIEVHEDYGNDADDDDDYYENRQLNYRVKSLR